MQPLPLKNPIILGLEFKIKAQSFSKCGRITQSLAQNWAGGFRKVS